MTKTLFRPTAAGLSVGLLLLAGCVKTLNHLPSLPPGTVPCKIRSITFPEQYQQGVLDSFTFEYNSAGNPVFATRAIVTDGTFDIEFLYDGQDRLTDFLNVFAPGADPASSSNWVKYSYANGKSQHPFVDSNFLFPDNDINGSPTIYDNLNTTSFQYDRENRITRDTTIDVTLSLQGVDGDTAVVIYRYGADGNLAGGHYDNKVNFLRTSKVFQFLQADYSVNNNITNYTNIKYNTSGLPTQFDAAQGINFLGAISAPGTIHIAYECTCDVPAAGKDY